ncbi:TetR/AcrR family transcriptional regulator [Dyadobacter luticola]|uniref:TetR/AcrR family transcriptional regulator n=1 Tax=Dyadobacter luticola TaxID=1979387 RepID=A0A5R9KS38_9BACT|nr:TetR/AcrR family transcriptional regulator [Dyadobacter luticola]TLU99095.1 TetR/AcrR family transcriptional regulator [Dyadobacter luticola]
MSKAEKTRQFIIEKTAPIFNTKGYAGTSITDLTEATGLTKGSIYGNFTNKDEVALAAFDHNLKCMNTAVREQMDDQKTAKEKLLVYVRVYENFLYAPFPKGGCPILNTSTEADDTHPGLRQRAADAIESWKNLLSDIIKRGIADKEFKNNIEPEHIAISLIALIEGGIMIGKVTGKLHYRKAIMESITKMIENVGLL